MSAATAVTAATATPIPATNTADGQPHVDSIPVVDLRHLSQSELYALSLCSPSSFDPRRLNDVVVPKIDRSIFNESAGSRKQTYSRLRLAPPSSATTASATIRRRTPHLRATNPSPDASLYSDPENAQIVTLLKQLFVLEETNSSELIPVRVHYSDSLPQLTANVAPTCSKRKRGRPKRNENAVPLMQDESTANFSNVYDDNVVMNEVVICENVEDRDKNVVNRDGVAVDLVSLGALKDPYSEELMRRTEGLGSEEQLLWFLKGLNGQWGSRRKKKRIVDASEFGNALPTGWRLLLSVKKKEGRVWVYCRRYISPNGRPFASCKEVSSYLLSLHGLQDAPNSVQSTESSKVIGEWTSASITDHSVPHDDKKEILMSHVSSPTVTSISSNHEVQIKHSSGDLPKLPVGDNFNCEKCNISFPGKDELLRHHFSYHKGKRSRGGQSITDGVIIKDGKYECQFCHKTFNERHRYNGHIGAHVKNQGKSSEESACVNKGEAGEPRSVDGIRQMESTMKTSRISISNDADASYLSQSNAKVVHYMETDSNMEEAKEDVDMLSNKSDCCSISEAVLSNYEGNGRCGSSVDTHASNSIDAKSIKDPDGQRSSGSGSSSLLNNETHLVENNIIEFSACTADQRQEAVLENSLLSSNGNAERCDSEMRNCQSTHGINELNCDGDELKQNESAFGLCSNLDGLEEKCGAGDKLHPDSEYCSGMNINMVNDFMSSSMTSCEGKRDSDSITLKSFDDGEMRFEDNVKSFLPGSQDEHKLDEMYLQGNQSVKSVSEPDIDHLACFKEQGYCDNSSHPSSSNSKAVVSGKHKNDIYPCLVDEPGQAGESTGNLLSLSGHQELTTVDKGSTAEVEDNRLNNVQNVRSNEPLFPCCSNQSAASHDSLVGFKREQGTGIHSSFLSSSEKTFSTEDNTTGVYCSLGDSTEDPSENVFLMQKKTGASDKTCTTNKIYATSMEELRLNGTDRSGNDLNLGFNKPQIESNPHSIQFDLEINPVGSSIHNSEVDQAHIVRTNMNGINHNTIGGPEELQDLGMDLRDSSINSKTCDFENNLGVVYPAQDWESSKLDVRNSSNKFGFSLGSRDAGPDANVMAGSIWEASQQNVLQGGLTNTSVGQSSSCLGSSDIFPDKGNEDLFRVNGNYNCNTGYEELGSGRNEPVEYSFMTTQNSNSLPEQSRAFSFDSDIGQGFDTSFWLGKDALMQNITDRNQVPTICVWCGNEFYHEPVHSGTQGTAIGSMCPTCNSRISEQFDVS